MMGNGRTSGALDPAPRLKHLRDLITSKNAKEQLAACLASHMKPDMVTRLTLTALSRQPELLGCTEQSICLAMLSAGQLGILPNGRDGHFVAYGSECTFLPDYKGLVKLALRCDKVASITCGAVRENDDFDWEYGSRAYLRHRFPLTGDRGDLIGAWAKVLYRDGSEVFRVMTRDEVLERKAVAKTKKVWDRWPDEMWAKTAIKAVSKVAPLGDEAEAAIAYEDESAGVVIDTEVSTKRRGQPAMEPNNDLANTPSAKSPSIAEDGPAKQGAANKAQIDEIRRLGKELDIHGHSLNKLSRDVYGAQVADLGEDAAAQMIRYLRGQQGADEPDDGPPPEEAAETPDADAKATKEQLTQIEVCKLSLGHGWEDCHRECGVDRAEDLTAAQADWLLKKLRAAGKAAPADLFGDK